MRQKSFLHGRVYFNNRRNSADCLIRDISAQGARVIFSEKATIPDFIELSIPQREETMRARVEWHHGDELGLSFSDAAYTSSAPLESANLPRRIAQLEIELASLQQMVERLKGRRYYADKSVPAFHRIAKR